MRERSVLTARPSTRSFKPRLEVRLSLARRLDRQLNAALRDCLGSVWRAQALDNADMILAALRVRVQGDPVAAQFVPELSTRARLSPARALTLHRMLRMLLLAEIVFGNAALACTWLTTPKLRFKGGVPVQRLYAARHAIAVEHWLVDIADGYDA